MNGFCSRKGTIFIYADNINYVWEYFFFVRGLQILLFILILLLMQLRRSFFTFCSTITTRNSDDKLLPIGLRAYNE